MTKSLNERIAEKQMKIDQTENQLKQLLQKQKESDRKARTRRLIERGAMLESMIEGADALSNEQIKATLVTAFGTDAAQKSILAVQALRGESASAKPSAAQGSGA